MFLLIWTVRGTYTDDIFSCFFSGVIAALRIPRLRLLLSVVQYTNELTRQLREQLP